MKYIKQIMKVLYSAPNVYVCLTLGILTIEHKTEKLKITLRHHIVILDKDDLFKETYPGNKRMVIPCSNQGTKSMVNK